MEKAEELAGNVGNRSGLFLGIRFRNGRFKGFAVGGKLREIAHVIPSKGNTRMLEKQGSSIAGLSSVDAPDGFVFV
jgi:hypothetical protein